MQLLHSTIFNNKEVNKYIRWRHMNYMINIKKGFIFNLDTESCGRMQQLTYFCREINIERHM